MLFGFSVSIAVVIVLIFYILQEKSCDSSYKNLYNLYMVVTTKNESYVEEDAKDILVNQFPQIRYACRYHNGLAVFVWNHNYIKGNLITTDNDFFNVFACKFILGNPNKVFSNENTIVLTESFSKKLFSSGINPIGQTLKAILGKEYTVAGVIEDLPKNSSIVGDCFINYKSKIFNSGINNVNTNGLFVALIPGIEIDTFGKQISKVLSDNSKILHNNEMDFGESIDWKLRPFRTAYYDIPYENDYLRHANKETIQILILIAVVVLLLSIINFINLNTANNLARIKEIGIRKISGASKSKIISNFLIESTLTCFIATIFAFLFTKPLIPVFEHILSSRVEFIKFDFLNVLIIIFSIFILGIISGILPAYIASRYSPILLFKSSLKMSLKSKV
jgi:putative ABC transport system permease protein